MWLIAKWIGKYSETFAKGKLGKAAFRIGRMQVGWGGGPKAPTWLSMHWEAKQTWAQLHLGKFSSAEYVFSEKRKIW